MLLTFCLLLRTDPGGADHQGQAQPTQRPCGVRVYLPVLRVRRGRSAGVGRWRRRRRRWPGRGYRDGASDGAGEKEVQL